MAKNRGRPSKYKSHVEPYLDDIRDMALTMTEEQIAKTLGVGYTAFREYKRQYPALNDALKKGRRELVKELRSTLIRRAKGFQYEEKKIIKEGDEVVQEIHTTKSALPDVAALNLLLKNYDRENWANDPQTLELRKKELALRERQVEADEW